MQRSGLFGRRGLLYPLLSGRLFARPLCFEVVERQEEILSKTGDEDSYHADMYTTLSICHINYPAVGGGDVVGEDGSVPVDGRPNDMKT